MATARVLIVDDEPVLLDVVCCILSDSGYEVIPASNGHGALEIVNAGAHIDLVLSDVVMPGMQGPVLLEAVRKASPSTALMLMSGYFPEESSLGPITPFLKKPFLLEELTEAVERTLARASQGEIA